MESLADLTNTLLDPLQHTSHSNVPAIHRLPPELKAQIVDLLSKDLVVGCEALRSLSLVDRNFSELAMSASWHTVDFTSSSVAEIDFFLSEIAPSRKDLVKRVELGACAHRGDLRSLCRAADIFAALPNLTGLVYRVEVTARERLAEAGENLLAAINSGLGQQLRSLTFLASREGWFEPSLIASVLLRCPFLTQLQLASVRAGESSSFSAALRSLRYLTSLTLFGVECLDKSCAECEWAAPIQHLEMGLCGHLPVNSMWELLGQFPHSLTTLQLDTFLLDNLPTSVLNLPLLTSLTIILPVQPFTFLTSFLQSPIRNFFLFVQCPRFRPRHPLVVDIETLVPFLASHRSTLQFTRFHLDEDLADQMSTSEVAHLVSFFRKWGIQSEMLSCSGERRGAD